MTSCTYHKWKGLNSIDSYQLLYTEKVHFTNEAFFRLLLLSIYETEEDKQNIY